MTYEDNQPGLSTRAIDSLTDAQRAVQSASEEVKDVRRHFRKAVHAAKRPNTYAKLARDCTRAAPLTMLGIAFVAGLMLAGRRG